MNGSDSISRNTAFAFGAQLTSAAFTAGVTLYLVRKLGPSGYGVFALAVAIGAMVVLLADLGVTQSAERFIAERRSQPGCPAYSWRPTRTPRTRSAMARMPGHSTR